MADLRSSGAGVHGITPWQVSGGSNPNSYFDSRLYVEESYTQDENANTTTITLKCYVQINASGESSGDYYSNTAYTVLGTNTEGTIINQNYSYNTRLYPGINGVLLWTITRTLNHNVDGTCGEFHFIIYGGTVGYTYRQAPTSVFTPPTIPRNSKLDTISQFVIGRDIPITFEKKVSTFTNDLLVYIDETLITTRTNISSPYTLKFTNEELELIYDNATSETEFTFNLITYDGATQIGSADSQIVIGTIPEGTGRIKINGEWKRTSSWLKINGEWKRASSWLKINGEWRRCI